MNSNQNSSLIIKYGVEDNNIDVTEFCFLKLKINDIIRIPCGDNNRAHYFTDPLYGILKKIFIYIGNEVRTYGHEETIIINLTDLNIFTISNDDVNHNINYIHSQLKLKYGSFNDELPEQKMVVRYLTGNEKVLEIGGNIGRNSLVIGYILNQLNNNNLVTLESDPSIAKQLLENKNINNLDFQIENSALSKRKLIQKGWNTFESNELLNGHKWVNTITLEQLYAKYNIQFDTLVLDCEGAFYYILMDMPEILDNIKLIIMENDYLDITKKQYIDNILKESGFCRDYAEHGGWEPCYDNFFEVWKKFI